MQNKNKTGLIYFLFLIFFFLTEKHDGRMYFNDNIKGKKLNDKQEMKTNIFQQN